MLVCEDESLYSIGKPVTHSNHGWQEKYEEREWTKLNKPADCTDFVKVVAGGSNRLILTRSGKLFCQGENLRLYIDKKVEKEKITEDFVNCTDVFPIDEGDQIVDVAAGFFFTVVVTEQGSAYAVGHDLAKRSRRPRYMMNMPGQEEEKRRKAYKIELPGRALKCWGHKKMSYAFIQIEDQTDGCKKMFSGCEFPINRGGYHGAQDTLFATGRGFREEFPNAYGGRRGPATEE